MQTMNVAEYRALLQGHPRPDAAQVEAFVNHVCHKHSWYKHLRLTPPGARFTFFLDPGAGMTQVKNAEGRISMREISPDEPQFHYAALPTAIYRSRFGILNVHDRDAPEFRLIGAEETRIDAPAIGVWFEDGHRRLPDEIEFIGSVNVTAVIHDNSRQPWLWERRLGLDDRSPWMFEDAMTWPEETGGMAVVEEILARLLRARQEDDGCPDIDELIAPERQRQRERMRGAIVRMIGHLAP